MKIYRYWGEIPKSPNPIQETQQTEETVANIAEAFPYANYFFVED